MLRGRLPLAFVFLFGSLGLGASCRNGNTARVSAEAGRSPGGDAASGVTAAPSAAGVITSVQGVDLAPLSTTERETFWAVANDELSPCGDPHSLAVCAHDHLACRSCLPALNFLAHRIQEGYGRDQLSDLVRSRYSPRAVEHVNTEGAPSRGSNMAAVTIVEFSDYECPHCGHAMPILHQVERDFEGRVRVVHMNFPLSGHTHALAAAKAALAAGRQGKFWEMHDLLFANQRALEPTDIDHYAQQVGLDLARFHTDAASPEIDAQVQATRHEGERLNIQGTPTIFINGRRYDLNLEPAPLHQWVQEELDGAPTP